MNVASLQNDKPVIQMFASLNQAASRLKYFEHRFQQSTLRKPLVVFSGQRATIPRDHVFALLGLLEPTAIAAPRLLIVVRPSFHYDCTCDNEERRERRIPHTRRP
jgi:hypothetical protein